MHHTLVRSARAQWGVRQLPRRKGGGLADGARTGGLEEDHQAVRVLEVVLEEAEAALGEAVLRLVHA